MSNFIITFVKRDDDGFFRHNTHPTRAGKSFIEIYEETKKTLISNTHYLYAFITDINSKTTYPITINLE